MPEKQRTPVFVANWGLGQAKDKASNKPAIVIDNDFIDVYFNNNVIQDMTFSDVINQVKADIIISASIIGVNLNDLEQLLTLNFGNCIDNLYLAAQDIDKNYKMTSSSDHIGSGSKRKFVEYVIVGQPDKGGTIEEVVAKVMAVYRNEMTPILCVGSEQGESKHTQHSAIMRKIYAVAGEMNKDKNITDLQKKALVVSYGPAYDNEFPSADNIEEMHKFVRKQLSDTFGPDISDAQRIPYRGFAEPNVGGMMLKPNVDGVMVGNLSLYPKKFLEIIHKGTAAHYKA